MDESIKFSIIVPVHNATTTLDRCIKSIVGQSYHNIECILIENGSTDDSLNLCYAYTEKYDCIKVGISEKGVSAARNLGLSMATGDVVGFCDADDFFEPGAFSTIIDCFTKNPNIVGAFSAFNIGSEIENGIQKVYKGINKQYLSAREAMMLTLADSNVMGSVWNRFYRADIAKSTLFDTKLSYCEDAHYNMKLLSSLGEVNLAYVIAPMYCYMMNDASVTHQSDSLYDANGNLKYIVALKKILNECKLDRKCQSIVKRSIVCLAIDYCWIGTKNEKHQKQLKREIYKNYIHFLKNITRFDFVGNLKRMVKSMFICLGVPGRRKETNER